MKEMKGEGQKTGFWPKISIKKRKNDSSQFFLATTIQLLASYKKKIIEKVPYQKLS